MNNNDRDIKLETERFNERLDGFTVLKNVITEEKTDEFETIKVPARTVYIFDLIEKE